MALTRLEVADGVATLTLDNPAGRNALTGPMVDEIVTAVDRVEVDEAIGALVVTGTPPAFCAGADLGDLAKVDGPGLRAIYEGFLRVARCTLPTLAAVNGPAVGAGLNMALGCDVRVAGASARFDTRFLTLGLHPGGGNTWLLQRAVGPEVARAALLFGEILSGAEAERVGLVYRCVPDDELGDVVHAMASKAASGPRELVVAIKRTLAAAAGLADQAAAVELEVPVQIWSTRQPWFAERLAALQARISRRG